jgi:hypothetical protein
MSKTVYQTGSGGVYLYPAEADESPIEPGVYLIPAGCVEAAPPEVADGHVAVWSGDAWSVVADHRGETWYLDATAATITFIGDPAAQGYVATAPGPTMDDLRAAKLLAIVAKANDLLSAGAPVSGGLHVALDDGSRTDLTALASTATAVLISSGTVTWPDSYSRGWITIENVRVPLATAADGLAFAASVGNYYSAIMQHRRDLKDAALASSDEAALDAIDISAGWPTNS